MENGSTPPRERPRRIGLEFEYPLTNRAGDMIGADIIQALWKELIARGWIGSVDPFSGHIHEVEKQFDGTAVNVSTDTAWTTLECSLPPFPTIAATERLTAVVIPELREAIRRVDPTLRLLSIGMVPGRIIPDRAYETTRSFAKPLDAVFPLRIANYPIHAHQVNVEITLPEAIRVINALSAVSGLIVALCANSSIANFRVLPWREWRIPAWRFYSLAIDDGLRKTFGMPERPFSSLEDYVETYFGTAWTSLIPPHRDDVPVIPDTQESFLSFFRSEGRMGTSRNGHRVPLIPSAVDLNHAFLMHWPFVKLHVHLDTSRATVPAFLDAFDRGTLLAYLNEHLDNCYIEFRAGATPPLGEEYALPACILGLIEALPDLEHLVARFPWAAWVELVDQAAIRGMAANSSSLPVRELLTELVAIARTGLTTRGRGEEAYLDTLDRRIASGQNPADRMDEFLTRLGARGFLDAISHP